jgi:hypothetical protein
VIPACQATAAIWCIVPATPQGSAAQARRCAVRPIAPYPGPMQVKGIWCRPVSADPFERASIYVIGDIEARDTSSHEDG